MATETLTLRSDTSQALRKNRLQKNGGTDMPKRMGGYIRVSTGRQAEEGLSLDAQRDRIELYCEFHQIELITIVTDNCTATKPFAKRPGGKQILDMIDADKIDGVVITKLDRAFRNAIDCLTMAEAWAKSRIAFHILDFAGNQLDTGTAAGRLMLTVLAGIAQMERDMTAERTSDAMAKLRRDGKSLGRGKFGWTLASDGDTLVPHPVQQKALRFIVHKYNARRPNKWGLRKIATWLRKNDVPTRGDLWWDRQDVQFVLDNHIPALTEGQKYLKDKLVETKRQLAKIPNHMRTLVRMANSSVHAPFPEKHGEWNKDSVKSIVANPLIAEEPQTQTHSI